MPTPTKKAGYVHADEYRGPIVPVHPNFCTDCTKENAACAYHLKLNMHPTKCQKLERVK